MPQNFQNHVKYYAPHHFIFYPLGTAFLVWCIRSAVNDAPNRWIWIAVAAVTVGLLWLSFMLRQHYALTCQDRIVRLELRFRYYVLTQQRLEPYEQKLSFGQLAALRFASDEELPALLQKAVSENLSAKDIKKRIQNWLPDTMRV